MEFPVEVWDSVKAMSFRQGAPCTRILKKEARQIWESQHKADWHVLGFTLDEKKRHDRFVLTERENVLPVLIEQGITKERCYEIINEANIALPISYHLGYPNANCIGCVKATSATYWNLVRQTHPEVFRSRAEQSRRLNVKLARHRGQRVFLDQLPADAKGRPLKSMQTECGIFCEERDVPEETELSPWEEVLWKMLG